MGLYYVFALGEIHEFKSEHMAEKFAADHNTEYHIINVPKEAN